MSWAGSAFAFIPTITITDFDEESVREWVSMKFLLFLAFVMGLVLNAEVVLAANNSMAKKMECSALKEELKAMQQAQQSIVNSLVSNHQTFAVTLEEYSDTAVSAPKVASKEMKRSAQSFRSRGVQGKKIAEKLNKASADLIARVATCL